MTICKNCCCVHNYVKKFKCDEEKESNTDRRVYTLNVIIYIHIRYHLRKTMVCI